MIPSGTCLLFDVPTMSGGRCRSTVTFSPSSVEQPRLCGYQQNCFVLALDGDRNSRMPAAACRESKISQTLDSKVSGSIGSCKRQRPPGASQGSIDKVLYRPLKDPGNHQHFGLLLHLGYINVGNIFRHDCQQ